MSYRKLGGAGHGIPWNCQRDGALFSRGLQRLFPDIRTDLGIRGSFAADGVTSLSRESEKAIFSSRFECLTGLFAREPFAAGMRADNQSTGKINEGRQIRRIGGGGERQYGREQRANDQRVRVFGACDQLDKDAFAGPNKSRPELTLSNVGERCHHPETGSRMTARCV